LFILRYKELRLKIIRAIIPPSLLGIERKIAQANKKYHSGWMWIGVTNGLASAKLSGSLNINGYWRLMNVNITRNKINPKVSFSVK
jgi:hypothetical protein